MTKIIFFGNGPLADYAKAILAQKFDIIFHAREKADLETVKSLKAAHPDAHGVLASFGVMIKSDVLDLFEPEGILNIHPSLLPKYRGASPIETAIINGDQNFSVSIMKLVKAMDAGPIYHQETFENLELNKSAIYQALAEAGAKWISENLEHLPTPTEQSGEPTFTTKLDKSMSPLNPENQTAAAALRQVIAFQNYPKSKYDFYNKECIILKAHTSAQAETLSIKCKDQNYLVIDELQPAGKKPMDAKSFLNGYAKN
jgi:methionyl-tRNA formyltransferase